MAKTRDNADIDTLARYLNGDASLNGAVSGETRSLARLAHRLQSAAVRPQPSNRQQQRDQMLEAARAHFANPPALTRLRRWLAGGSPRWRYSPRVAAATGAAALALSSGGVAYAADASLPGDTLYPVKLTVEDARLAFVSDRADRGRAYLEQASTRIAEAEASLDVGDPDAAVIALRHADDSAQIGADTLINSYREDGDVALIEQLTDFTTTHSSRLTSLSRRLDGEAADAAVDALLVFERIKARASAMAGMCPQCNEVHDPAGRPAPVDYRSPHGGQREFEKCPCPPLEHDPAAGEAPGASEPAAPMPRAEMQPPFPPPSSADAPTDYATEAPADAASEAPAPEEAAPVDPTEPAEDAAPEDADDLVPDPPAPRLPLGDQ